MDGHVDARRATEAGEWPFWLAGRETPQREREGLPPDRKVPGLDTAEPTLEAVAGCAASSHPDLSST